MILASDLIKLKKMLTYLLVLVSASFSCTLNTILNSDHFLMSNNANASFYNTTNLTFQTKLYCLFLLNYDPVLSIVISLLNLFFFGKIIQKSCLILSQAVPSYVDLSQIEKDLKLMVNIFYLTLDIRLMHLNQNLELRIH